MVPAKDRRRYARAHLHLPLRIRWRGPLGLLTEINEALEVSRDGVLLHRAETWAEHTRLWVTMPFDPSDSGGVQPEMAARVVRATPLPGGGRLIALHFELPLRRSPAKRPERRAYPRLPFALPISVRRMGAYWPEATMSIDLSQHGVRFEAARFYACGDTVRVHIPCGAWAEEGEIPGRVLRVEAVDDEQVPIVTRMAEPGVPEEVSALKEVAVAWRYAVGL
jgi:hypothetical protein